MSTRGSIKVFSPKWVERDSAGGKVTKTSTRFAYRFWFRAVRYQQGGYETKRQALESGEARKSEVKAGQENDWRKLTFQGLQEIAEAHIETARPSTQRTHANAWKRLRKHFPSGAPVQSVDDVALLRYVSSKRKQGCSDNSIRLDLAWLRKAMRVAHHKRLLPWLPQFPRVKYKRREQTFVPGELARVLLYLPLGYQLLFRAAEESGCRTQSELTTRKWTDVDFDGGWLSFDAESTKAGKARRFPLTGVLRGILEQARSHVDEIQQKAGRIIPWVFVRDDGKPIRRYGDAWRTALSKAGFTKLPDRKGAWSSSRCVHDLRRGALRRWKAQGLDQDARMALAGHGDAATHALYLSEDQDEEALRAAARALDLKREELEPESKVVQLTLWAHKG